MRDAAIEAAIEARQSPLAVVTIQTAAATYRVAGNAGTVDDATAPGGVLRVEAGLLSLLPFSEEFDGFNLESLASLTQVQVAVLLEPFPLAGLEAVTIFAGAQVEVAMVWPGQDWSVRRRLLVGRLQGLRFGNEGDPITFTAENTPPLTSGIIGDDTRDLGEYYSSPHDADGNELSGLEGRKPAIVLGAARRVPGYKIGADGSDNRLFLCEHELPAGDVSYYEDGGLVASGTPLAGSGPSGAFRYIAEAAQFTAATGAYTWDAENGGLEGSRNAADVLRLLLRYSGLKVDADRMGRAYGLLRGWEIGMVIDSQAPAIEVIRQRLLPFLPLVEVNGQDGIWFAYVNPLEVEPKRRLIVGDALVGRMGEVIVSDLDQIRNSFTVAYGYDSYTGAYSSSMALGWRERDSTGTRAAYSAICRQSYQLFGDQAADLIECPIIWDRATAERLLHYQTVRALPRLQIQYLCEPRACYDLEAGDVVTLQDVDLGLLGNRAIVRAIERTMLQPTITLETVPASAMGA